MMRRKLQNINSNAGRCSQIWFVMIEIISHSSQLQKKCETHIEPFVFLLQLHNRATGNSCRLRVHGWIWRKWNLLQRQPHTHTHTASLYLSFSVITLSSSFPFCLSELDLCSRSNGGCSEFAVCTKVAAGMRTCTCKQGYTGDGVICLGMWS